MSKKKRIIVLGGGYGGILTAKKLEKKFKGDVQILLIDKNSFHTMRTELHEVACGRVKEDSIRINLKKVFDQRSVEVIVDEIGNIDFENGELHSKRGEEIYQYDYLVIGAGSKPTYFGIKGAEANSLPLWEFDDAVNIKEHILTKFRAAAKEGDRRKREELLSFVIVGGGFTGVEMMGELGEWKDELCRDFYISSDEVKLTLVDAMPKILSIYPEKLISKAEGRLKGLGVEVVTGKGITEVSEKDVSLSDGSKINSRTVIWAAGVEGVDIIDKASLQQKGRKRIVTNDKLQVQEYPNVYVVGDNIFYVAEGEERPLPQMVENAKQSAATVADNIYSDFTGKEKKRYKPQFHGSMVCIGSRYGIAHLGLPGKFISIQGFLAMFLKHAINLVYFLSILGFNKCWKYVIDEFINIENRRSMVGGHLAKAGPTFWLVPLRGLFGVCLIKYGITNGMVVHAILGGMITLGIFTSLSTIVSMILFFVANGMFSLESLGYFCVSIAMFAGAGRVLGGDYYLSPLVKKGLKKIKFIKKYYLYID